MQQAAIAFGLLAMLFWGVYAALANVATQTLSPTTTLVISYITGIGVVLGYFLIENQPKTLETTGVSFALAAGFFSAAGTVAFFAGLNRGSTGTVTTISALYFVVATILGVIIFKESLALADILGISFAVLAVLFLLN